MKRAPWPVWIALIACVAIFYLVRDYIEDDTFINFRYVWQWAAGNGIVWNPGERVEGYTSVLMLVLLRGFDALGMNLPLAARTIGIAGYAAVVWLLHRYFRARSPLADQVVLVVLLTSMPLIAWSVAGLETLLFTALLTLASLQTVRRLEGETLMPLLLGLTYALATLARPEGLLCAVIGFLALLIVEKKLTRALFLSGLFYAAIVGTHLLWRHAYYGEWLPNTYYAKLASSLSAAQIKAGYVYVISFLLRPPYLMIVALGAVLLAGVKRQLRAGDVFLLATVGVYTAYILYTGGDWMLAYRFFVPLMPLLVLLLGRAVARAQAHSLAWAMPWAALLFCLMPFSGYSHGWQPKVGIYWQAIGQHIANTWPRDRLIAINMAGIIPAMTMDHRYLDMLGLNDAHIARRAVPYRAGGVSGHMKGDGAYVVAQRPYYIIFGDGISQNSEPHATFLGEWEMMKMPEFNRLYQRHQIWLPVDDPAMPRVKEVSFQYYERRQR